MRLEEIMEQGLGELGLPCTPEALERFRIYYRLLEERGAQMNLTAISGEENVAKLHFLDCAALLRQLSVSQQRILDVGSGAGFPGLVLKILAPAAELTLLDSLQKRVQFQQEVCEALGLQDVRCLHLRAEEAPPDMREAYDLAVSRAVARLNLLSELCLPFVRPGGRFAAMKGPAAGDELQESLSAFRKLGAPEPRLISYRVPGLEAERTLIVGIKQQPTPPQFPRRFAQMKKKPL
ncbi:MAG: 16S rRNA (guanine(527)-N(7))-methyltransferase RsmG [Oscillospiraceae bacterium]|nr:16S rRNA (guanine(527)-N(7))-methyltransferase RsmG [Oscillospiraceae bacterium]